MKQIQIIGILWLAAFSFLSLRSVPCPDTCDVVGIYSEARVETGTLAKLDYGGIKEVKKLFVPTTLTPDKYSVSLSHEEGDIYKIKGHDLYIKLNYCLDTYHSEATLKWESNYGYSKGKLIFTD